MITIHLETPDDVIIYSHGTSIGLSASKGGQTISVNLNMAQCLELMKCLSARRPYNRMGSPITDYANQLRHELSLIEEQDGESAE